ncbi:MAG: ATP-binding cassette domain-containing protein [Bdellovibrio sp.]
MIESLEFRELAMSFDDHSLFAGINFQFPMDSVVCFCGELGSGRSTVLQILAGLILPSDGSYLINSRAVEEMSFEEFLSFRLKIGYAFDLGGLLNNRSLLDNLTLPLLYHRLFLPAEAEEWALQFLEEFQLQDLRHKRPSFVSPNVRKLVVLLRSLIHRPEVLLLDDPATNLRDEQILKFFDLVERHRQKENLRHIFLTDLEESFRPPGRVDVDINAFRFHAIKGAA